MDFLSLAKKRYSTRSYENWPVEEDKLKYILEAGRVAPTAKNLQPYRVLVVQKKENLQKLSQAARIYGAPLALIVCKDTEKAWIRPMDNKEHGDVDATIITDHMMMAATELNLQSIWICYFDAAILKKLFSFPSNLEPVNILAVGYGNDEPQSENRHKGMRRPLGERFFFETFKEE